jgi:hypothetical protein
MLRSLNILFAFVVCGAQEPHMQSPAMIEARQTQRQTPPQALPRVLPLMREYRGVKLGINRFDVKAAMGRTARAGMDWDEFRLGGSDLMTVRYDNTEPDFLQAFCLRRAATIILKSRGGPGRTRTSVKPASARRFSTSSCEVGWPPQVAPLRKHRSGAVKIPPAATPAHARSDSDANAATPASLSIAA